MSQIEVKVPDIGDFKNVPVIEVLVKPGDTVKAEDPLIALESDKATMEVPAPPAGVVGEILVKVGDKVSEGMAILTLQGEAGAEKPAAPAPAASDAPLGASQPAPGPAPNTRREPIAVTDDFDIGKAAPGAGAAPLLGPRASLPDFGHVFASPAVRRLARELDLDLSQVPASGDKGRITKEDVKAFLGAAPRPRRRPLLVRAFPKYPPSTFPSSVRSRKSRSRASRNCRGRSCIACWLNVPAVTQNDEADITDLEEFRKKLDEEGKKAERSPIASRCCLS